MNKCIGFFKRRISAVLLFHVGVLLFNWPLLSITGEGGGIPLFAYVFIAWAATVATLFATAYAISRTVTDKKKD